MPRLVVDVLVRNKCPKITFDREINTDDFSNVDEKPNAIFFILEEDKGWSFIGKIAVLKVRFDLADEMKDKLEKYLDDATLKSYAMNLWKVHRFEVKKNEATPEKEDELKEKVRQLVVRSIQMINDKADFSL